MPKQEIFLDESTPSVRIAILKSYDEAYAREAFQAMDDSALDQLWKALGPESIYEPAGLPKLGDATGEAESFLWDELVEQAKEDGSLRSFFVVNETEQGHTHSLYVSPDWPSAESFARERLALKA